MTSRGASGPHANRHPGRQADGLCPGDRPLVDQAWPPAGRDHAAGLPHPGWRPGRIPGQVQVDQAEEMGGERWPALKYARAY